MIKHFEKEINQFYIKQNLHLILLKHFLDEYDENMKIY